MAFDSHAAPASPSAADDLLDCGPFTLELVPTLPAEGPNGHLLGRDLTLALAVRAPSPDGDRLEELQDTNGYVRQTVQFMRTSRGPNGSRLQNANTVVFGPVRRNWPASPCAVLLDERGAIIAYGRLRRTGGRPRSTVTFPPGWIELRRLHRRTG